MSTLAHQHIGKKFFDISGKAKDSKIVIGKMKN
jgi:hypothetical protein